MVDALAQLDVGEIRSEVKKTVAPPSINNVIDLNSNKETPKQSSGFSGLTAKPVSVFVSTKFNSSGGAIDKFESASSLRSYGAFS